MMLNNKLKEDKRIQKIQKQMAKKKNKGSTKKDNKGKRNKSKFASKYSDRIDSIRNADERIKREKKKLEKKKLEKKKLEKRRANRTSKKRPNNVRNPKHTKEKTSAEIRKEMMETLEKSKLYPKD